MFSRKAHGDVKKSTQKVLDPKKDVLTRLKHLRTLLDTLERSELKQFFETNYSQIYFIFFENLFTLESSLKQKGNKSQREELDSILFVFEKILQLLPEKINNRWQFHSIGSILKKLLHTGNSVKIRSEGIRLYLLWLQALQENSSDEQLTLFACLVPGFPAVSSQIGPCTLETLINPSYNLSDVKIAAEDITPLLPSVLGEKISDDQTLYFLQILLKYMVIQAASLEWKNKDKQESGFKFLFALFKKFYLSHLFPSFTKFTNLYNPVLEIPQMRPKPLYINVTRNNESVYSTRDQYLAARVAFIKWLVTFFLEKKYTATNQNTKNGGEMLPKIIQSVTANPSTQEKAIELEASGTTEQDRSHSNSSTLSERRLSTSSLCSIEEEHQPVYEMVQRVLFSSQANVNFINEVFHQGFLLPSCEASAIKKVVKVYRKWILQENKPPFMAEPEKSETDDDVVDHPEHLSVLLTDNKETIQQSRHRRTSSWGRTYSFTNAINRGCVFEEENANIQAGIQSTLQVFLTNSANVFLLEPCTDVSKILAEQIDVCKAVLSIYRHMIMELNMSKKTWEQLLRILLKITEAIMPKQQDLHNRDIFAEHMAGLLFRTLIVAWIRANLSVYISRELWDELLSVLSSLTAWNELIAEWAKIMDSLTVVLARCVYGLDMNDLPLDKLSEQKEKKQRGRGVHQDLSKVTGVGRSFSLSWRSQADGTQEHMRFRSATTSGAPGVEKARNIVRQKATAKRSQSISNCVHLYEALPSTKSVPLLLHTVSSLLPGITHASSQKLSEDEEFQQPETTPDSEELMCSSTLDQEQKLTHSSSTSDIAERLHSDLIQGQRREHSASFSSSDSKSATVENRKCEGKETEAPVILIRRSSSPEDLENKAETLQSSQVRSRLRNKSESISSEASTDFNGFTETELSLVQWKIFDEDSEVGAVTTDAFDADTVYTWHRLSSSKAATLAGSDTAFPNFTTASAPSHLSTSSTSSMPSESKDSTPLLDEKLHQSVLQIPEDLDSSECLTDECSIIAGGTLTGWHADAAAVLWRRILGILGDVNCICCPKIHALVFEYLYELWHKLAKIRDNLGVSLDNQNSPQSPILIPPLRMFVSWLFKATTLPNEYKEGRLQAYRLICDIMTKRQDVLPNSDFLVHCYHVIHRGIVSEDQDVLNVLAKHCSPRFFLIGLPGFTMMVGDFITVATRVLNSDVVDAPRYEAQILLGSLVCFPNLYQQMSLLQPVTGASDIITGNEDIKDYLINILIKNARNETCETARCIAMCSLGIWISEELVQCTNHTQVQDALNVLGVTLKFSNKVVAEVACDMLKLLVIHMERLEKYESQLPKKIAEILVATIAFLLPSAEHSSVDADKRLIVSLLLCLLDWCMAMSVEALLEPISATLMEDQMARKAPLLDYVYRVLHSCVYGSHLFTQQSQYLLTLADVSSTEYDPFLTLGNVKNSEAAHSYVPKDFGSLLTITESKKRRNLDWIPLTARMVMAHLINHLGHYPLSGGPAVLHSLISENHDNPYIESSDLSAEVFKSPNLQLFVLNDSTLISYLQIPTEVAFSEKISNSEPNIPASDVRIIVRDISGKYSWDGQILYGPLSNQLMTVKNCNTFYSNTTLIADGQSDPLIAHCICPEMEHDDLDHLLENLSNSSPECLPHPQLGLSEPAPLPIGMNHDQERNIIDAITRQNNREEEYIRKWSRDQCMSVTSQKESVHHEPQAQFYYCRLFLNDMGMNSWERRNSFHLLKKNSKLLRELKNLDSRQCRETHKIAVFYIMEGQEDKYSILSNTGGSQAYENLVSGLGWEIDLSTHCGFMGGLQRNGSTGQTAPYYATSTVEVIFHVSTRMPSDSDDSLTKKLRHLGNDEVHIIWSEHSRDYRRGIIPTDFGDVLIIIYPMKNCMFYIQILKKPEVPFFGPLFDGAIVNEKLLPSLVRATGINASRAVKSLIPLYQSFYEERAQYVEAIVQQHKEIMTFEDFAAQVFCPSPSYTLSNMGSLNGNQSTEMPTAVGTVLTDHTSPPLPHATKTKVSGKLRHSASSLSRSSQ
ncbi:ral GTPase-activating protein subunit alpha-2 isoform X2 [Stegostoma tigrinum]|uniref:ral GTPase-activating protein subunit alpha-2 isoform X2 n=1 Tax=Stegostoma tigrinum TaxID=3053191 RepID=UPI00286FE09F|nr:ral GTPase-activating protein subunit alpha-2 isoform X2 [Stegostoma tigrinum]